jgi:hypothetical protein
VKYAFVGIPAFLFAFLFTIYWLLAPRAPVQAEAPVQAKASAQTKVPVPVGAPIRVRACIPYTVDDFVREHRGMTPWQLDRLVAITPPPKPGDTWCKDQNGKSYLTTCYSAYIVRDTTVHSAPFVNAPIDSIAAGGNVCAIEHNSHYVYINYVRQDQWYGGWIDCGNISVTEPSWACQ